MGTAARIEWDEIPTDVRDALGAWLGSAVVEARNEYGGYSPSLAARCGLADDRRVFLKVASVDLNPMTPEMMRYEARMTAQLPEGFPAPRLLDFYDDGHWVALAFEEVAGHMPTTPWAADDLVRMCRAVNALSDMSSPSPVPDVASISDVHANIFGGWRHLAGGGDGDAGRLDPWSTRHVERLAGIEADWEHVAAGDSLLHFDIRSDNVLFGPDDAVWFVDWANAARGAAWLDYMFMLAPLCLEGAPPPAELWRVSRWAARIDRDALTTMVVALAGYFTAQALRPSPPGLPTVRAFQAAQGEVTRGWAAELLDAS